MRKPATARGAVETDCEMIQNLASLKNPLTNQVDHWRRKVTVHPIYETISPPSIPPQLALC